MRHALEADHVAAVATLAAQSRSTGRAVRLGIVWGVGHTLTLFVFGSAALLLEAAIPTALAFWLEMVVAVMLILLGADVLRRLLRDRIHFHVHRHGPHNVHLHAHSHRGERAHDPERHDHDHPTGFPVRALVVGLVHGMAGSAALILLTVNTVGDPWLGLAYIGLFGIGSSIGMAALSIVIAVPLHYSGHGLTWLHNSLQAMLGIATIALGVTTIVTSAMV